MKSLKFIGLVSASILTSLTAFSQSAQFDTRGIPTAIKAVAEEENKSPAAIQSTSTVALEDGGTLTISIQPAVVIGQRASLVILPTANCHVRVFHFSSDQHTTELFPGSTNKPTAAAAHKKLTISWETTPPGGLEHVLVYASKGEITNTAYQKGTTVGDYKVFEVKDIYNSRGIPTAIRAAEVHDTKPTTTTYKPDKPTTPTYKPDKPTTPTYKPDKPTTPTYKPDTPTYKPDKVYKIVHARLCYHLKEY